MSMALMAGMALAKEFAPDIINGLIKKGDDGKTQRVVSGIADVAMQMAGVETEDAALEVYRNDPELRALMETNAKEIAIERIRAETEQQKLQVQEMQSARTMYTAGENTIQGTLVVGAFVLALGALIMVAYMNINQIEPTTLTVSILTAALSPLLTVFGFFFGSSIGSKQKTSAMVGMEKK